MFSRSWVLIRKIIGEFFGHVLYAAIQEMLPEGDPELIPKQASVHPWTWWLESGSLAG